jgi:hypothetical protein
MPVGADTSVLEIIPLVQINLRMKTAMERDARPSSELGMVCILIDSKEMRNLGFLLEKDSIFMKLLSIYSMEEEKSNEFEARIF